MHKKFFVTMTDKFMSGWGMAQNKINKLIIECYDEEQARTIERNAKSRSEMKHISIHYGKTPYYGKNYYLSYKTYDDLGDIWKK
jgi:hypothetical protein